MNVLSPIVYSLVYSSPVWRHTSQRFAPFTPISALFYTLMRLIFGRHMFARSRLSLHVQRTLLLV